MGALKQDDLALKYRDVFWPHQIVMSSAYHSCAVLLPFNVSSDDWARASFWSHYRRFIMFAKYDQL